MPYHGDELVALARRVIVAVCLVVAVYYALYSLYLGVRLTRAVPYFDQWAFVFVDYYQYLDGKYHLSRLFRQTNEHRHVTARLVMFADAIWFQMRGYFPLFVAYVSLAGIALMLAKLAVRSASKTELAITFFILLGITWSICLWHDLTWAYQVYIPLLHLFALASLFALAIAVTERSYFWLGVAVSADALAIWSAGSALVLILPALLLCFFLRSLNGYALTYVAAHAIFVWLFLSDYRWRSRKPPEISRVAETALKFLGWPFYRARLFAGAVGLAAFAWLSVESALRRDRNLCVLVAFAAFVLIEGMMIGYSRPGRWPISERHAAIATMFPAAVIAALWRHPRTTIVAPIAALVTILAANAPIHERQWRAHVAKLDRALVAFRTGQPDPEIMKWLAPNRWQQLPRDLGPLKKRHLGPFADVP